MKPFHSPFDSPNAINYISDVLSSGNTAGGGKYYNFLAQHFFKKFSRSSYFTTSCTSAMELLALAMNIQKGDEVILPTYTFPSTANAFALRGAKLVFVDSQIDHPNIDLNKLKDCITPKTRLIIPMYYGGVSLDWDVLNDIRSTFGVPILEEAAHAFGALHVKDNSSIPLGKLGDYAVFSFHETKNISCGEGGLLLVSDEKYEDSMSVSFEKGTNKREYLEKNLDFYEWRSLGSSFVGSELNAAYLLAQLEQYEAELIKRLERWRELYVGLSEISTDRWSLPIIPEFAQHNAHIFYLRFSQMDDRISFEKWMLQNEIPVSGHYRCLHSSYFGSLTKQKGSFENAISFQDGLCRITMNSEIDTSLIIDVINEYNKL